MKSRLPKYMADDFQKLFEGLKVVYGVIITEKHLQVAVMDTDDNPNKTKFTIKKYGQAVISPIDQMNTLME